MLMVWGWLTMHFCFRKNKWINFELKRAGPSSPHWWASANAPSKANPSLSEKDIKKDISTKSISHFIMQIEDISINLTRKTNLLLNSTVWRSARRVVAKKKCEPEPATERKTDMISCNRNTLHTLTRARPGWAHCCVWKARQGPAITFFSKLTFFYRHSTSSSVALTN